MLACNCSISFKIVPIQCRVAIFPSAILRNEDISTDYWYLKWYSQIIFLSSYFCLMMRLYSDIGVGFGGHIFTCMDETRHLFSLYFPFIFRIVDKFDRHNFYIVILLSEWLASDVELAPRTTRLNKINGTKNIRYFADTWYFCQSPIRATSLSYDENYPYFNWWNWNKKIFSNCINYAIAFNEKLYPVMHNQTKKCILILRGKLRFKIILRYFLFRYVNYMI